MGGLVEEIRNGGGPAFLHAETYRHIGHTVVDPATYRPDAEVVEAKTRDPIERSKDHLRKNGTTNSDLDKIANDAENEMTAAFDAARDAPWPDLSAARTDVQDAGGPL